MAQAIVVGGGLAGVSAANTVLECGGKVVLVDKSAFCGGNSTKATSGINGAETQTQKVKKVGKYLSKCFFELLCVVNGCMARLYLIYVYIYIYVLIYFFIYLCFYLFIYLFIYTIEE